MNSRLERIIGWWAVGSIVALLAVLGILYLSGRSVKGKLTDLEKSRLNFLKYRLNKRAATAEETD